MPSCTYFFSIFIFACSATAQAQDLLKPIVVYGDRLHSDEQQQEGTTNYIVQDFIKQSGAYSRDALLPSLGGYVGNPISGNFSLRGLNAENVLGAFGTRSNSILVPIVDGIPISASTNRYFPRLLAGVSKVTVLKGGQSTNYGPNALGGVISYQDPRPLFDYSGSLFSEFAERGHIHLGFTQNIPLLNDSLAASIHYQSFESDGHYRNVFTNTDDWGKTDRHFFKGQLLWEANTDTSVLAVLEYEESRSNPFANSKAFGPFTAEDRRTNENTRNLYPADRWLASLTLDHSTPNGLQIKNVSGFTSLNVNGLIDLDGGSLANFFANSLLDEAHFTNDFSVNGTLGDNHLWSFGAYTQISDYRVSLNGILLGLPFLTEGQEDTEVYSLYGKMDFALGDAWHLIGGLRINHERRDLTATAASSGRPTTVTGDSNSYTDFLPSLTLAWEDEDRLYAGLKLSRNYRGGGVSYAPSFGFVQSFDPEYSDDAEFFFRYRKNEKFNFAGSIYYSRHTDMQVPAQVPMGLADIDTLISNSGEGRRFGAEITAQWQPIDDLTFDLSLNYNDTEFTSLNLNGIDRSGQAFPNAPKFIASTSINYQPETGIFGNLRLDWADETYTQATLPGLTSLESRFNISTRLGYRRDNWETYLFVNNLLNRDYALGRVDGRALGNGILSVMNEPRTFGAGLKVKW